jgi:hypothetical protein
LSQSVIVITVEGISTSLIGAFGSSLAETPTLDAMAARGIVLDQCFLDSREIEEMLKSLWSGQHALIRLPSPAQLGGLVETPECDDLAVSAHSENLWLKNIWRSIESVGGSSLLVTDCPKAALLAEQLGCEQVELVEHDSIHEAASDVMQCAIVELFSAAAEAILALGQQSGQSRLCWIHSKGLRQPWDAPIDLRISFKDAEDPDPPSSVEPPAIDVTADTDPDLVVGWSQVAAAQVEVLDQAVALLRSVVQDQWSWCILGIDGCPLGEHGRVGFGQKAMHSEQLQVVAIMCPSPEPMMGWRVCEICQLPDVAATIASLAGVELSCAWGGTLLGEPNDADPQRWDARNQVAVIAEGDTTWVRTPAWCGALGAECATLYVKPDDRWEASEVGNRCADVLDELREVSLQFVGAVRSNRRSDLQQLSELLCNLHR